MSTGCVGQGAVSADALEHLESRQLREHEIEYNERGLFFARCLERLGPVGRR